MKFMKSVGRKIFFFCIGIVCLSMFVLGTATSLINFTSTMDTVRVDMTELARMSANYVHWQLQAYLNIVEDLGQNSALTSEDSPQVEKLAAINACIQSHGFTSGNYATTTGDSPDGNNYADRPYFKNAIQGKSTISSPTVSKLTGELVIIFAAPITANGQVSGVVFLVPDSEFLNDIMRSINISKSCEGYALDSGGHTIAAVDAAAVADTRTADDLLAADSSYADLASCHRDMCAGNAGFQSYKMQGQNYFTGYAPIEGTDGWSLAIRARSIDFMGDTYNGIVLGFLLIVACAVICGLLAARMGTKIGRSVRFCTERMQLLAQGDLKSPVPEIVSQDETGALAQASQTVIENLKAIIEDIGRVLGSMANKNFDVHMNHTEHLYIGDYADILKHIRHINHQLSATLSQFDQAADQVSMGAEQVSAGAQSLAQGATEQASSMEELAAAVHTISDQVADNAQNCSEAKNVVHKTGALLSQADEEMRELTQAMKTIDETSKQISGIIKAIEDIAFQTNILALNAAVEAARAGEAGKGFSVVADEVRNLASKSGQAAQDTSTLIEKSVLAVANGVRRTNSTAGSVSGVHELAVDVERLIDKIATASQEQASMVEQITAGMDQVSSVVQTNSATAEQSAAASRELSGQSDLLKEQIAQFTLRRENVRQ